MCVVILEGFKVLTVVVGSAGNRLYQPAVTRRKPTDDNSENYTALWRLNIPKARHIRAKTNRDSTRKAKAKTSQKQRAVKAWRSLRRVPVLPGQLLIIQPLSCTALVAFIGTLWRADATRAAAAKKQLTNDRLRAGAPFGGRRFMPGGLYQAPGLVVCLADPLGPLHRQAGPPKGSLNGTPRRRQNIRKPGRLRRPPPKTTTPKN